MTQDHTRVASALRAVLLIDALTFLAAALFNFGISIPLGFATLYFPAPVWQAGAGEAVIGATLLAAALTGRSTLSWIAWALSVLGIAFGLRSVRVVGPARDIHVLLVPLAVAVLALLVWRRQQRSQPSQTTATPSSV